MKTIISLLWILGATCTSTSQVNYGTPPEGLIPEKINGIPRNIEVVHFPKINDPIKIDQTYYWKHLTSIVCKTSEVTITEYGAYLYYNDQWNLRKSYPLKELNKNFGTKNQKMNQAEPYTWPKNYRTGAENFGGWALWYFIGTNSNGDTICGYETVHTTSNLLN